MFQSFQLPLEFQIAWWQWGLAALSATIIGLSKGGIKGISVAFVTLMALVFGGKASTGIIVPLLTVGDIFAVIYYNRHAQWRYLYMLLPWMAAGVLLGVWFGKDLPELLFKRGMAIIILVTIIMMYWWERNKDRFEIPDNWWFSGLMGLLAGFTTMIGNLAGAFANIFFLAMRLPKNQFIGTAAWLFLIMNLFKLPFHYFVWGTVTTETLLLDLRLAFFVIIGIFLGIQLVKLIKEHHYRQMILLLTALGAILIFFR